MSAERPLQAAIYTALTNDSVTMGLVSGIYDGRAPQGTAFPYTVLGDVTEVDEGPLNEEGWSLTVTIHDWSDYEGKKECQEIREARDDLLHRKRLTVTGFGPVYLFREFAQVFVEDLDPDQVVRHGVSRYRATAWAA